MACLQHCLLVADPIVCCVQAWTSSAHGFLPSSASVYASTVSVFGSKSPLRRLDGGHWSLVSGLVVVSAVYFFREHGHTTRERRLRKELLNSQAEISKLVMKVIHNQAWVDALSDTIPCSLHLYHQALQAPSAASTFNGYVCGCAGRQHAALHAITRASAHHPPHLQHVCCDALPIDASRVKDAMVPSLAPGLCGENTSQGNLHCIISSHLHITMLGLCC